MGKMINYVAMLVALDLIFLITGQLSVNSNLSLITGALLDPSNVNLSSLWTNLFVAGGLATIALGSAVLTGLVTRTDNLVYVGISITLANLLIGDLIGIFNILRSYNEILATVIMAPIIIIFAFVMVEWARGKD